MMVMHFIVKNEGDVSKSFSMAILDAILRCSIAPKIDILHRQLQEACRSGIILRKARAQVQVRPKPWHPLWPLVL